MVDETNDDESITDAVLSELVSITVSEALDEFVHNPRRPKSLISLAPEKSLERATTRMTDKWVGSLPIINNVRIL